MNHIKLWEVVVRHLTRRYCQSITDKPRLCKDRITFLRQWMINLQCSLELLNFSASKFLLNSSFSFCLKIERVTFVGKRKWRTGALILMTSIVPKAVSYKLFLACSWLNCSHERFFFLYILITCLLQLQKRNINIRTLKLELHRF